MADVELSQHATSEQVIADLTARIDELERVGHLGSWNIDFAEGVVESSPWLCQTLNVAPCAAFDEWRALLSESDLDNTRLFFEQATIEHMPFTVVGRLLPAGAAEPIWFRHRGKATYDNHGDLTGFSGISQRIDHEMAATAEREGFHETLQRVQRDESSSYLAGGLAHELSNLLQPVLLLCELTSIGVERNDMSNVRTNIAKIEATIARAGTVLRSALDFARLDSDDPVSISVDEMLHDLQSFLDDELLRRVDFDIADDAPACRFLATRAGLVQLTLNLLKNASEASRPEDRIDLIVCVEQPTSSETPTIRLTVQDRGAGFSEDALTRAFDPRFTTRFGTTGNGLGLAVVRALVERWGGAIRIQNNPTRGARVVIKLPALAPTTEEGS